MEARKSCTTEWTIAFVKSGSENFPAIGCRLNTIYWCMYVDPEWHLLFRRDGHSVLAGCRNEEDPFFLECALHLIKFSRRDTSVFLFNPHDHFGRNACYFASWSWRSPAIVLAECRTVIQSVRESMCNLYLLVDLRGNLNPGRSVETAARNLIPFLSWASVVPVLLPPKSPSPFSTRYTVCVVTPLSWSRGTGNSAWPMASVAAFHLDASVGPIPIFQPEARLPISRKFAVSIHAA